MSLMNPKENNINNYVKFAYKKIMYYIKYILYI